MNADEFEMSLKSSRESDQLKDAQNSNGRTKTLTQSAKRDMMTFSRQRSRASGRRSYKIWVDTWYWEILCLLSSIGLLVAMAVLLRVYDGQPIPSFQYGITLNTIIALLTTFSKASLAVATTSGISQLKWQWYQNERFVGGRPIRDIQIFDDASRGPWGATVLLFKLHVRTTASLGALVVVLALILDPFAQQLITYSTRAYGDLDAPTPSINFAQFITAGTNLDNVLYSSIWSEVDAAVIYQGSECQSDLCRWDSFDTLGFRAPCQDRTEEAILEGCDLRCGNTTEEHASNCTIYLPGDYGGQNRWNFTLVQDSEDLVDSLHGDDFEDRTLLQYPQHAIWPVWSGNIAGQDDYMDILFSMLSGRNITGRDELLVMAYAEIAFDLLKRSDGLSVKRAQVCALTPSVETLGVESHHGTLSVDASNYTLGTFHEIDLPTKGWMYWRPDGAQADISSLVDVSETPFFVDPTTLSGLCMRVRDALAGNSSLPQLVDVNRVCSTAAVHDGRNLTLGLDYMEFTSNQNVEKIASRDGGLEWAMQRVSSFLTHYARTQTRDSIAGLAYSSRGSVEVWWPWLAFPVAVMAGGTAFLALVVCSSSRSAPLWKSSVLPLIYHGVEHRDVIADASSRGAEDVRADLTSGMDELGKRAKMRLRRSSFDGELRFRHA